MSESTTPRGVADGYLVGLAALDPATATYLGLPGSEEQVPDLSPAGLEAKAELARRTLEELSAIRAQSDESAAQRRCARLLTERLAAALAVDAAGEGLRTVRTLASPVHALRESLALMPKAEDEDWARLGGRLARFGGAIAGYRATLETGLARGLVAGPRQVRAMIDQLGDWVGGPAGNWFQQLVSSAPSGLRPRLDAAAADAAAAISALRGWLADVYTPVAAHTPDAVGRERYALLARYWTGADLDLDEVYRQGWAEFHRLCREMRRCADQVVAGAGARAAMEHLNASGRVIHGTENARAYLQDFTEATIDALDGRHFDIRGRMRRIETVIAPPGSAAAPYYTAPSLDFSRPGRTWLPARHDERYPVWELATTWYHEGVPGHHLQRAQWIATADTLSRYQMSTGMVGANVEGWALYAERLMDELGFLEEPGHRLGYLNAQMLRAIRVIVDVGMHAQLDFPADSPHQPGRPVTPRSARDFMGAYCGYPDAFLDSEIDRYLSLPGQAISYKLGEQAWLRGREAARRARADAFDLKTWHGDALSLGSLGLDDLVSELSLL